MKTLIKQQLQNSRRAFTLLEVMIVMALIALMAGFGTWSLTDLLTQHRRQAEVDDLKNFLQELQLEALALESDLEVTLYKEKGSLKVRSKTAEKILRDRIIELKEVNRLFINDQETDRATFQVLSTGRFYPLALIGIERKQSSLWVDVRQPIQIKYFEEHPGRQVVILPNKPKLKEI